MNHKSFQQCLSSLNMATMLASHGNIEAVMNLLDKDIPGTLDKEQARVIDQKLDTIAGHFFANQPTFPNVPM